MLIFDITIYIFHANKTFATVLFKIVRFTICFAHISNNIFLTSSAQLFTALKLMKKLMKAQVMKASLE